MRWSRLTWQYGNNAFAYEKRKYFDADPKLWIPPLQTINSVNQISLWSKIVFCECDDAWSLQHFNGLNAVYQLDGQHCPIYIFDNHNYALWFWGKNNHFCKKNDACNASLHIPDVIHIDQHSDLWPTPNTAPILNFTTCTNEQLFDYAIKTCNVGNFINPALESGIIWSCNWIKNQYDLEKLMDACNASQQQPQWSSQFRLDIDLDFWAPWMESDLEKTIPLVRRLMREASLITIATSPYFLDQTYAITLLEKLFYDAHQGYHWFTDCV
jgi:UPF0489 domain